MFLSAEAEAFEVGEKLTLESSSPVEGTPVQYVVATLFEGDGLTTMLKGCWRETFKEIAWMDRVEGKERNGVDSNTKSLVGTDLRAIPM